MTSWSYLTAHILPSPNIQINHQLTYLDVSSLFISLKSVGITFVASDPEPYGFGSWPLNSDLMNCKFQLNKNKCLLKMSMDISYQTVIHFNTKS